MDIGCGHENQQEIWCGVYCIQTISHQISRESVNKLGRDKSYLPQSIFIQNNLQQADSPFEKADITHWTTGMIARSMIALFQYQILLLKELRDNKMLAIYNPIYLFIFVQFYTFIQDQKP